METFTGIEVHEGGIFVLAKFLLWRIGTFPASMSRNRTKVVVNSHACFETAVLLSEIWAQSAPLNSKMSFCVNSRPKSVFSESSIFCSAVTRFSQSFSFSRSWANFFATLAECDMARSERGTGTFRPYFLLYLQFLKLVTELNSDKNDV